MIRTKNYFIGIFGASCWLWSLFKPSHLNSPICYDCNQFKEGNQSQLEVKLNMNHANTEVRFFCFHFVSTKMKNIIDSITKPAVTHDITSNQWSKAPSIVYESFWKSIFIKMTTTTFNFDQCSGCSE